jgi:hypothetical protein
VRSQGHLQNEYVTFGDAAAREQTTSGGIVPSQFDDWLGRTRAWANGAEPQVSTSDVRRSGCTGVATGVDHDSGALVFDWCANEARAWRCWRPGRWISLRFDDATAGGDSTSRTRPFRHIEDPNGTQDRRIQDASKP